MQPRLPHSRRPTRPLRPPTQSSIGCQMSLHNLSLPQYQRAGRICVTTFFRKHRLHPLPTPASRPSRNSTFQALPRQAMCTHFLAHRALRHVLAFDRLLQKHGWLRMRQLDDSRTRYNGCATRFDWQTAGMSSTRKRPHNRAHWAQRFIYRLCRRRRCLWEPQRA